MAVVGLAVAVLVLLVLNLLQARRLGRLRRRIERLTRGSEGRSLEAVLEGHLDKVLKVERELDELAARQAVVESGGRRAFQRLGIVRFNPFEDSGGNQSFAVALLDAHGDGFVLSSLHSRVGTRVYAKGRGGRESGGDRIDGRGGGPAAGVGPTGRADPGGILTAKVSRDGAILPLCPIRPTSSTIP